MNNFMIGHIGCIDLSNTKSIKVPKSYYEGKIVSKGRLGTQVVNISYEMWA